MKPPKKPTIEVVQSCLESWNTLDNYKLQEKSLKLLFGDYCSENKKIEEILLKVSTLNDFYSTQIYDTYSVAHHILKCDIDKDLNSNNVDLVDKIASGHGIRNKKSNKELYLYSFASKYCSHHKSDAYAIYDSYVDQMLWHFKSLDNFDNFERKDLKNYRTFLKTIENFKEFYKLNQFSLREIDIYLWLAGKDAFPKYSRKKNNDMSGINQNHNKSLQGNLSALLQDSLNSDVKL